MQTTRERRHKIEAAKRVRPSLASFKSDPNASEKDYQLTVHCAARKQNP